MRVDIAAGNGVVLGHLEVDGRVLLHLGEHLKPAPPASPARDVGRVSHHLQFAQDGAQDDERHVDEAGLRDVEDAAVDDDRRVQQHGGQAMGIHLALSDAKEQRAQLGPPSQPN